MKLGWKGHVARMGEKRLLVKKPEGNKPLGRPSCRWEYNIKSMLNDMGRSVLDSFDSG
jgi:hypothetical protein